MSKFLANEWNKATEEMGSFFEEMDAKIKNTQETPSPAPWEATPLQIYAGKKHIATAHYAGNPTVDVNEAIANARLIAAAPELLEALKWALDVMEIHKVGEGCGTQKAARAAIAKAEG